MVEALSRPARASYHELSSQFCQVCQEMFGFLTNGVGGAAKLTIYQVTSAVVRLFEAYCDVSACCHEA